MINNKLTSTSATRHGTNPATLESNPEVPVSTLEDVDNAVASARKAFKPWAATPLEKRREALLAFCDAIHDHADDFAPLLTREQGKPLSQATQEVNMATMWIRAFCAMQLPEEVLEEDEEKKVVNRYTPLGVCCGIVPWNYPILLMTGKVAPALYTGNCIIIKPSPYTPYCNLKLGELARKYFPPGVLQVLSGGDDLGPMLTAHPDIDKISFTGSSVTGKKVMESCAKTLKRITLELGGNDPAIICEDVDIAKIIPKVGSRLSHRGLRLRDTWLIKHTLGRTAFFPMLGPDLHDDQAPVCSRKDIRPVPRCVGGTHQDPQVWQRLR